MNNKVINSIPQEDITYIENVYINAFEGLELIGSGSSNVYRYKNYAIKYYEDCGHDGKILEKLQDSKLFPTLYFYNESFMVTEYLEITNAYNYFERNVEIKYSALEIYRYCYSKNLVPFDLHDDNVVVTSDDKLKIIDVGNFYNVYHIPFEDIIEREKREFIELDNIINHVKRPPIII